MCAPAVVPLLMTAVSTGLSMYSQSIQQKTQENAAKASAQYNAEVAANEAATQRQLAQNEVGKGIAERNRFLRAASQRQGEMTSALAASGFQLDTGTNLSLLADSAEESQYDANIITQNANMSAWERQSAATAAENQKSMFDYQYANAGSGSAGSLLGMGGTLLGGIASGMTQYNSLKNTATVPSTTTKNIANTSTKKRTW